MQVNSKSSTSYIGRILMWLVNSQTVRIPLNAMIKGDGQYQIISSKKPAQFNSSGTFSKENLTFTRRNISS